MLFFLFGAAVQYYSLSGAVQMTSCDCGCNCGWDAAMTEVIKRVYLLIISTKVHKLFHPHETGNTNPYVLADCI